MKAITLYVFVFCAFVFTAVACSTKKCIEKEPKDCICTMQYDPVCGCNNKTYSNACEAECHGITSYEKGPCDESN